MPVRNSHWYNANEGRAYPIDDAATCEDDAGRHLPSDLIADISLRWPSTLGRYAFITAVANTPLLTTITIQAADEPDAVSSFTPLAVISARKPITHGRVLPLVSQVAGVMGWIVFGAGVVNGTYAGRFSSPRQSRLTARAARAYRQLPVWSLSAANMSERLTGVVTLKATAPLAIAKEERFLDGAARDCIVVRLAGDDGAEGFPVPPAAADISGYKPTSIFQQFAGPCAGRPESNTCGCPEPIEFINAVPPDCNGVTTLEFRGCAQVAEVTDAPGVAVACELGLVDACLPAQIPSSEGLLPSEYEPTNVPVPPDIPTPPVEPQESASYEANGELPYLACFSGGLGELGTAVGVWTFVADDSLTAICPPTYIPHPVSVSLSASASASLSTDLVPIPSIGAYRAATAASRNVALYDVDITTVYRRAVTEVKLLQGPVGAKQNAQLVINYRAHTSILSQSVYFAAEVDYDTQTFRLLRFNGTTLQVVAPASVVAPGIQLGKWYRITCTVLPGVVAGSINLSARLESITDVGVTDVSLSVDVSNYQPADGKFGIGTNRALAEFAYLQITEAS